jgi:hypothetical protein
MDSKIWVIMAIAGVVAVRAPAANVEFYSDATIGNGDVYDWVYVYDTPPDYTVVDMYDGSVFVFVTYDSSTVNIYGGALEWGIVAYESSTINIYDGTILIDNPLFGDSSTVNIYGGDVRLGAPSFDEFATLNIYGYDFNYNGFTLTGFLSDDSPFEFIEIYPSDYTHISLIPVVYVEVDIKPELLNLASKGKWINCHIRLPEDCNVVDVNSASVFLEDEIPAQWIWFNETQNVVMTKFARSELVVLLEPGNVELTVSGFLNDGRYFIGTDTIKVIDKGRRKD